MGPLKWAKIVFMSHSSVLKMSCQNRQVRRSYVRLSLELELLLSSRGMETSYISYSPMTKEILSVTLKLQMFLTFL